MPEAVKIYIEKMLKERPNFTGQLILHFKDGIMEGINETKFTKAKDIIKS